MGVMITECKILPRKPEGKRLFGICSHRWEVDSNMHLKVIEYEGMG
jgi:hypothetical protein